MKTRERKEVKLVPLRAVNFGEAFEYEDDIFIKCLSDESNGETTDRIGINVDTGRLCVIDPEELVKPIDAEIVINK